MKLGNCPEKKGKLKRFLSAPSQEKSLEVNIFSMNDLIQHHCYDIMSEKKKIHTKKNLSCEILLPVLQDYSLSSAY